jgi:FKBP-type peptidyl-prolyl cis-trans isomerase
MGVDVETLEKGDAQVLPSNGDRLTVNYCGWRLADGKEKGEFDSSYSPTGTTKGKQ